MFLVQITAGQGPDECALAVKLAAARFLIEASHAGLAARLLDIEAGAASDQYLSVLLRLEGEAAPKFLSRWEGTVLWVCPSPLRPQQRRKNWFIGVSSFEDRQMSTLEGEAGIRFEVMRSSGAGGQHVNKTESAVRAVHEETGITVKVQSERSQHANKRLAVLMIQQKLADKAAKVNDEAKGRRRLSHHQLERGSPVRTFRGPRFLDET